MFIKESKKNCFGLNMYKFFDDDDDDDDNNINYSESEAYNT